MLPEPEEYSTYFHETYREHPDIVKKRLEWKKPKKKNKSRSKQKNRIEMLCEDVQLPPEIELPSNASAFAVFASIRLAVLDRWMKQASQDYLQSSCSAPLQDQSEIESDTEENSQSCTYTPLRVSKVVGLGLRSVFEIIKESRMTHPSLCTKALSALLDVLQGQSPEDLKSEPLDIIDPLFDLLLDLATLHGPESSVANDGTHLTAIACGCLLSLVVVRGDTGKYLAATAALLMCPRALSLQNIQMPAVLSSLQRSVHGVLLGRVHRPDWITHGIPVSSKTDSFHLLNINEIQNLNLVPKSLAMDGLFLYLFTSKGLFKIGSGYGGTMKGHIYLWKPDFYPSDNGSLTYCAGKLYLKLCGRRGIEFLTVERNDLLVSGSVPLHSRDAASAVVFSDGEYLGTISPSKDDGFVIRMLNQNVLPASVISELPLKLARKCVDVLGSAAFEDEGISHTVNTGTDEEIATICSGKEFGLIRTVTGKALFCGKAAALGIKQSGIRSTKWAELLVAKTPKITQISVGHDGLHAILVAEDGSAFFTGTARRGEDGDQSKVRRQPKSIKPKKIIKADGYFIVSSACNNGTTALVTREGELLMFGKDTTHADPNTGVVYNLKGEFIAQVALGKAHAVALTSKGQIYTFGINNKYQCGREFIPVNREGCSSNVVEMETCATQDDQDVYEEPDENRKDSENVPGRSDGNNIESQMNMCPPGMHAWHDDRCMICTICRECTGYSISCLSSISERSPGQECGCGEGDSGCSICGCCRICAREVVDNSELADLAGMMRLDLIFRDKVMIPPRQRSKLQEQIQTRLEERKLKGRKSTAGPSKQNSKIKITRQSPAASPIHRSNNLVRQSNMSCSASTKDQVNSDVERDATRIACLPPAKVQLPCNSPVVQIACGQHHSILLCQNGQVYSFGSNIYGQLGCGDILAKNNIQLVKLPCSAVHVAAGNNHTVVLTSKGEVYTFGNHPKGQLGRSPVISPQDSQPGQSSSSKYISPRSPWYSIPTQVPNIGPRHGRRATWVGASGDQTFIKIDESLINALSIAKSTVTANKNSLVLVPNHEDTARSFSCLVINKRDGNCNSFKGKDQMSFCGKTICLDPTYNVLWSYNVKNHEIECFNIISSELNAKTINKLNNRQLSNSRISSIENSRDKNFNITAILSPELSLPLVTNCFVTRFQAALNLLCTLDTLTVAHDLQMAAVKEETDERQLVAGKLYSKEDYQVVNRFEGHGGGWGYSGHSIEAIRFMVDTDILLGGFGLFGGRGEYTAKLKLFDIGPDGGEQEGDGELITETEEIPYECGPRQKCSMLFDEPVQLQAHRWYVAWCRISGPSSDCGSSGQTMVTSEDQVLFYFKSSKKSNNGTDVNAGQIPQLLYKVITPESQAPPRQYEVSEPVHILSKEFSRTVTKECFQSLLSLLQWSWNTFKWGIVEGQNIKNAYTNLELERLVYISKASLRLIRTYINEIYPCQVNKKLLLENVHLAESIGDVRSLLKQILSDNLPMSFQSKKSSKLKNSNSNMDLTVEILEECHRTFVQCFHAFYPTAYLKWTCLCNLLTEIDKEGTHQSSSNSQRLLSAVLCSLCSANVRLRSTFPLLGVNMSAEASIHRNLSPSDNTGHPMMSCSDSHHYPILVEQMSYKSQMESSSPEVFSWPWNDVLEKLLHLVADPIIKNLNLSKTSPLPGLTRHCCHLLGRVVAELVHQCSATEEELQSGCGRILHITPSRFTRTNQSRTWNTGNGSPDAICFQVDHPGISIAGVGVYGGIGHYDYEVELLEDSTSIGGSDSHTHTQRWNILEVTRGSFGPEDFAPDIIEIKFERAVPIKENTKYAIRLRNHGGRTNNGDGGLSSVKGSDGTNFVFSTCALSFNGTTLTRGQIPVLLYYSNPMEYGKTSTTKLEQQARKSALSMTSAIFKKASELMTLARSKVEEVTSAEILSDSCMVTTLLPLVAAHTSPLVTSDPRSAVYMLGLIYDLLPHVAALNLLGGSTPSTAKSVSSISNNPDGFDYRINTSSPHYIWVESEHPYKPAAVSNYRVKFPESVKWLSLEFDPSCSTVQPEDSLQLYVPALGSRCGKYVETSSIDIEDGTPPPPPYWPVLHKFSGSLQWPANAVILPGNEVIFSLETASDYLKDDKASAFGFKCLVIGYEWPLPGLNGPLAGLKHLESELAFLGGMCAASLMKKDLLLPTYGDEVDLDVEMAEMVASVTFAMHAQLLSKGLALNNPPSVSQALDGMLPYSVNSNERMFLRDFVGCVAGTSGGRLAQWLQPGSRVDPSKCQVLYSREELRCGWPAMITVITRDQYSDIVQVPNMKVDIKAIPIDKNEFGESDGGRKVRRVSQTDVLTFGGLPPPPLHYPYEPTVRDKMYFHSITVMKPYQNYSFEELRYISPPVKRSSESMMVRSNLDGTYAASWTPASVGCYSIVVNIDGYDMEEIYRVEVKEPPQGMTPPSQQQAKKNSNQPNKLRKFVAKNSAGLRIRAHPSLQSEQIGVVYVNGTIAFIDEIHNDDGVWLRLSMDTIKQYCNGGIVEAWCLQYNQHLGKTLLLPVEDPKSTLDQVISETINKKLPEIHDRRKIPTNASGDYILIKCGASGHNVRSKPHLNAPRVGMLVLGNRVGVSEYIVNSDGCWVLLDETTRDLYCFNTDDEAWSLAMDHNNTLYLGSVTDKRSNESSKKGFDFTQTVAPISSDPHFFFGSPLRQCNSNIQGMEKTSTNPFIFGECSNDSSQQVPKREKKEGKINILPKWLKGEDEKSESSDAPNFHRQEPTRSYPESRANGNGTPPDTPKRSNSPNRGPFSPKVLSRSSSPVAASPRGNALADSAASTNQVFGSPKSIGISPLVSSNHPEHQPRRDSTQSDTSAFGSSLTRDSQSPGQVTPYKDLTSSPSGSSIQTKSDNSPPSTPCKREEFCDSDGSPKKLTQTGTQTSPESLSNLSIKGHFSIGSTSREEKISPKLARKDRGLGKVRPKRSISPAGAQQANSKASTSGTEQAKIAMSPTMAEALRAVFAAFLWHEGIVHDAMACASFLKFHPTLPKQGAVVVTRHLDPPVDKRRQDLTKEERARQRHSVEVTTNAGSYLHIQPATLESLTRSAANANANRNRSKRISNQALKDEADATKGTPNDRSGYGLQTVSVLPPALKSLVYLWEELSTSCFQAISQQMILQSPLQNSIRRKEKLTNNTKNDCRDKNSTLDRDSRRTRKKKSTSRNFLAEDISVPPNVASDELENICELCGENYQYPVTFHMNQAHPGCGQHAGGKGYNSRGNYCLGWAGSCGDGGIPGSSWYLMCENCREKYVKAFRSAKQFSNRVKNLQRRVFTRPASPSLPPILEPHIIMKNNAMFLLDLASSADTNMTSQRRSSMGYMPSLSENNSPPDCSGPFSPMPPFQCLQSLGASLAKDETNIYEVMFRQHNMQDGFNFGNSQRPLSEISVTDDLESAKGSRFHRSISMGTNGIPWYKSGIDGRMIMTRRRNNSSSESLIEGGSSLLCNPSGALQQLIPKIDHSSALVKDEINGTVEESGLVLLQRPVMQFLLQHHDLQSLKLSMRQALRKAMCRVYAMQALNWLLKSVTQPLCLHDLLWWFVTSLTPTDIEVESEDDNRPARKLDDQDFNMCEHPLSDIIIAGDAVHPLPSTFHALLQTIADLMVLLPMGSPIQQMAVRCWGLRFATSDHSFLHRSQVFSNISKILSRSEELEDCTISMHDSHHSSAYHHMCAIESLKDLTFAIEIKSSSRQAMVGSLTDSSTETFWESGDEDRNKTKSLVLVSPQGHYPVLICVHIDNCRDLANKVSNITFYSGPNSDDLVKLGHVELETRLLGGWVNCPIPENNNNVIKVELKGPDNSVRVRQIRVLGKVDSESLRVGKQLNPSTIQQKNCEAETLRVFRLITSQVFGKLIQREREEGQNKNTVENSGGSGSESLEPLEESNDLREHMVGILFSRSKLTHLQKQVIVHIVQAIRKETLRVRDEWELSLCSSGGLSSSGQSQDILKNSDTYCFEMLSMVLALSGSSVGRAYLSHQGGLLGDMLSLLHTGSARVQRQVTSLLRRMLPEITPDTLAKVMGVTSLPPKDFNVVLVNNKAIGSEEFDIHRAGILDVFLSIIAKALTVQVKLKGKTGCGSAVKEINTVTLATSVHPKENLESRWWLKGYVNRKLAEVLVNLIKDMAAGKLSDNWARIAKGAIAENILNLTHLSEEQRTPSMCLKTPTLWLALASLCVLDKDHVDRLSSGQWTNPEGQPAPPRPTCSNHDDGETNAVIQCSSCGNLCADCDRFLHLHRKTRYHQRQVCKEEEEAIKVELHEGCGRIKLFWLLALADARTLKALIEYREGGTRSRGAGTSGICRFCGATGTSGLLAIGNVCADQECQEYSKTACTKLLNCGHMCGGILDETKCLPCLHGCTSDPNLRQDADDMCMICFTEALSCAPAIQLTCGHVFHLHCCRTVLLKKWSGPRITFSFSQCPICKKDMEHPNLEELLEPIKKLLKDVQRKALMRLEYEGLHKVEAVATPGARFYNDPVSYAMDRYAYYVCFKCNKAYYGGEARCDAEVGENYDPTELVCGACSDVARAQMCPKHGTDFLEYKCRYCCSVAVFFCFGTTHFCNPCHDDFQRVTNLAKSELPNCPAGPKAKQLEGDECPLHIKHPPTGEEFALGCGVCRNAHTF